MHYKGLCFGKVALVQHLVKKEAGSLFRPPVPLCLSSQYG